MLQRDKYGRTPVVVGRGGDGYAIATESSAFANLDYRVETELKPAQTLFITADGIREITPGASASRYVRSCGSITATLRRATRA